MSTLHRPTVQPSVPPASVPPLSAAAESPADALEAPPLPLHLADPVGEPEGGPARDGMTVPLPRLTNLGVANRIEETEEQRAERARIPSWDDILLGVRRKRD